MPPGSTVLFKLIAKQLDDFMGLSHFEKHALFASAAISQRDIVDMIRGRMEQFRANLDRPHYKSQCRTAGVPRIVHRLWITSASQGFMPPAKYLKYISSQTKELGPDYLYIFWCNSDEMCEKLRLLFLESEVRISVKNLISAFQDDKLIPVIQGFVDVRKYVLAADVAKMMILDRFGGVYADLGVQFGEGLLQLIQQCDAAVFLDIGLFFQPAFIALCPKSQITGVCTAVLKSPEILSSIILADIRQFTPGHEVWIHGGVGFTITFLLFQPSCYRVLVLPPQGAALQTTSEGSWYRDGSKFGNVVLKDARVTHLDVNRHRERVESISRTCQALPPVSNTDLVRLNIYSGLKEYFLLK